MVTVCDCGLWLFAEMLYLLKCFILKNVGNQMTSCFQNVRLQITSGRYRTKRGQVIRTEFIERFAYIEHVQSGKTNSSMNSVRIA